MTADQMLQELQSLLDEQGVAADQGFYSSSEDLGLALNKARSDLLMAGVSKLEEYKRANIERIPFVLVKLITTATGTVTADTNSVDLPTYFLKEISVKYSINDTIDPQLCRENAENGAIINRNEYSSASDFDNTYQIKGGKLTFGTVAVAPNGQYELEYIDSPVKNVLIDPTLTPDITHETLVQGAFASILRKNEDFQEAALERQEFFNNQVLRLVEL